MRFLKVFFVSVFISIFTFLLYAIVISFDSIQSFNGICPAAPTDIPAYPCTFEEFLIRIFFSPWAIMTSMIIFPFWFLIHFALLYLGIRIWEKSRQS